MRSRYRSAIPRIDSPSLLWLLEFMKHARTWASLDPFVEAGPALGRSVANMGLLRALLREDPFDSYHFFLGSAAQTRALRGFVQEHRPKLISDERLVLATRPELPRALRSHDYYCFHLSDCINAPAHLARLRNLHSKEIFPITSTTHSLSYARLHKDYLAHLWPGCTARDAVIATSPTARQVLQQIWEHLRQAYGLQQGFRAPETPVIPLGIDCEDFTPITGEERQALRRENGVGEGDVALLVFARLSHSAKLDALPVLRALSRAAAPPLSMKTFTLIMAGASDAREESDYLDHLRSMAGNLGLKFLVFENPDERRKLELFSLSDMLLSPVDNYQETFGISLLEAGAMGLPAVVSDFDGYRSLVRDGETGVLVPTLGAADSSFSDAAGNLLLENQHQLLCAQQVALDVPALARALRKLALSPGLRASMGQAARRHVCQEFSWKKVIWRYMELWESLWHKPVPKNERQKLRETLHPLHVPLAEAFAGYPSKRLESKMCVCWSKTGEAHYRGREGIALYGGLQSFLEPEWVRQLLFFARKGETAGTLAKQLATHAGIEPELAEWCLLWCLKHDLLERCEGEKQSPQLPDAMQDVDKA